jgi:hypothetical protein
MYRIKQNIQQNNDEIDKQIIKQQKIRNQTSETPETLPTSPIQNYYTYTKQRINNQLKNHNDNNYYKNYNNNLQYDQQQELINDVTKMHLMPPYCEMTPKSYTDFYNDSTKLYGVTPYHLKVENHKKDGKPKINLQYNNFYSDVKYDAIKYNSPPMAEYENKPNKSNIFKTKNENENIKLYKETKNQKEFAIPMKSNGSNKIDTLFNDCMNKPTFEYKKFGYNMLTQQNNTQPNTKTNHLVDNPLYNMDISEETNTLYTEYMDNREQNVSNIYSAVFEDMYILCYNPHEKKDIDETINPISTKFN